jgi:ABC-type polysaccharide/polyol phosphate transport system ATPase subunit
MLVSHNLDVINKYCNKALFLKYGEQVAFGDTKIVINKYLSSIGQKTIDQN